MSWRRGIGAEGPGMFPGGGELEVLLEFGFGGEIQEIIWNCSWKLDLELEEISRR